MKVGDRIVYVEVITERRLPGVVEADDSRGGDGPPLWCIRLDDGARFSVWPDRLEPESAVDQLARVARGIDDE